MKVALIRHGPTAWNEQGRIQGRIDIPLSAAGRAKMERLGPPEGFPFRHAYSSPLRRARETAALLGLADPILDGRLAEHDWGKWEGLTRPEILARDGEDAFARAGTGIDFMPPGGEPTRDLVARVRAFLSDVGKHDDNAVAVTHRGVLRSAYAIATSWDMLTPMPEALDLTRALILSLDGDGGVAIAVLNAPLSARRGRSS